MTTDTRPRPPRRRCPLCNGWGALTMDIAVSVESGRDYGGLREQVCPECDGTGDIQGGGL